MEKTNAAVFFHRRAWSVYLAVSSLTLKLQKFIMKVYITSTPPTFTFENCSSHACVVSVMLSAPIVLVLLPMKWIGGSIRF